MPPTGPFKLVTVNTAPDRARRLIGRVVADVKEQYTITHAANAASMSLFLFYVLYLGSLFISWLSSRPFRCCFRDRIDRNQSNMT